MKLKLDFLTGGGEYMAARYRNLYGDADFEEKVKADKKKTMRMYILILTAFVLIAVASVVSMKMDDAGTETSDNGALVSIDRPEAGEGSQVIEARVWASKDGRSVETEKSIVIDEQSKETKKDDDDEGVLGTESEADKLERRIDSSVRTLNQDTTNGKVVLPTKLDDGTRLVWKEEQKSNVPMILAVMILMLFMVYSKRFSNISKQEIAAKDSITRAMPEFINKIVLLLQGGVVLGEAFERVISDYEKTGRRGTNYFYDQLSLVRSKVQNTNSAMHEEFAAFAKRSGVRELMRLANIIRDNISKGSDLMEKLTAESRMLWFARKKRSEERGRLAETKLTLPLVILILVLVLVTIAPAMMQM